MVVMLVLQILLIIGGVTQLIQGDVGSALFNIITNIIFGYLNLCTIKEFDRL